MYDFLVIFREPVWCPKTNEMVRCKLFKDAENYTIYENEVRIRINNKNSYIPLTIVAFIGFADHWSKEVSDDN